MCKYSTACRRNCRSALLCPDVEAAFGNVRVKLTTMGAPVGRPAMRLNKDGKRLCATRNCVNPRIPHSAYCLDCCRIKGCEYCQRQARKYA